MSGKVIPMPRPNAVYPTSVDGLSIYSPDRGKTWRIAKQRAGGRRHEVTLTREEMETLCQGWNVLKKGLGQ